MFIKRAEGVVILLKNEREQEILTLLRESGYITVKQLGERLYASESSIRRALAGLENKGLVRRTYGGAELLEHHTNIVSFGARAHHNIDAKKDIAKKAAGLVRDGDVLFLDQSTTALFLAERLMEKSGLTVVTSNLQILSLLSQTTFTVYSSSGRLSESNRMCLVGADAQSTFAGIYADAVFFSANALSDDGIVSDCNREEVFVRNAMLQNADRRVFLCDSEKFGKHSAYHQCALTDVNVLISEGDTAQRFAALEGKITLL
jgi:DeoR/GlpR family transcriptional regulator of sugar metabolism